MNLLNLLVFLSFLRHVFAMDRDGKPTTTHTYWKGFKRATAVGLILEHATP